MLYVACAIGILKNKSSLEKIKGGFFALDKLFKCSECV